MANGGFTTLIVVVKDLPSMRLYQHFSGFCTSCLFSGLALAMPDVRENARRTEADLFRGDRHLSRFRLKPSVLAVRVPWDVYDRLTLLNPEVFIDFPHYRGMPYLCASLANLGPDLAQQLLDEAWEAVNEVIGPRG